MDIRHALARIADGQNLSTDEMTAAMRQIMTGAAVPSGADCVVPVEITRATIDGRIEVADELSRDNICRQAEDIHRDDTVLEKGACIGPQHIGVLATVGCTNPLVARQPAVGVIATGDEIVEPGETPAPAQIRNSNGHQLCAQVRRAGGLPTYCAGRTDPTAVVGTKLTSLRQSSNNNPLSIHFFNHSIVIHHIFFSKYLFIRTAFDKIAFS